MADGARTGVRRVSFSSLEHYERCPRSYYLERVLGFDPDTFAGIHYQGDRRPRSGSEEAGAVVARAVGTVVHLALEESDLRTRSDPESIHRLVARLVRREGIELDEEQVQRAAALVSAFWESDVAPRTPAGALIKERPFLFDHEGVAVSGFMDLVIEDEVEWTVVDYKTTRLVGRGPGEAAAQYRLQGRLYALACLLAGAKQVRVAFLFLEAPGEPVVDVYRVEDISALRDTLGARLQDLASGDFSRCRDECGGCGLDVLCRALPE